MKEKRYNILFLCDYNKNSANTIIDHCESFRRYSKHNYYYVNPTGISKPFWLDMDHFDIVIIHYSIYILGDWYIDSTWRKEISRTKAYKVQFIQDEYRTVNAITQRMRELGINMLFTCVPEGEIEKVYPEERLPGVRKINTLTGYCPEYLVDKKPDFSSPRPIDVGYRGRALGYWLGELAQEKRIIAEKFLEYAKESSLVCNISYKEEDRIYGEDWVKFLKTCRCVLGTESGASVVDFTGEIEKNVQDYLKKHPNATFEEVRDLFFKDEEYKIKFNQISPRIFESIACGCCLVLFEGEYSGIVVPDRHYIPLKKDFSNIEEVIEKIKDRDYTRKIAETAFKEIIEPGKYFYKNFISEFDKVLDTIDIKKERKQNSTKNLLLIVTKGIKVTAQLTVKSLLLSIKKIYIIGLNVVKILCYKILFSLHPIKILYQRACLLINRIIWLRKAFFYEIKQKILK